MSTPEPSASPEPVCGNGVVEQGEECDGQVFCATSCEINLTACCEFDDPKKAGATVCGITDGTDSAVFHNCAQLGAVRAGRGQVCMASDGSGMVMAGEGLVRGSCQEVPIPATSICCESRGQCSQETETTQGGVMTRLWDCAVMGGPPAVVGKCNAEGHCAPD
jgi:hypothetical protein